MRLFIFISIIFTAQLAVAQQFDKYFAEGSLRFDYYHTGNSTMELMSNDEIIFEKFWGGSKVNLVDTFDYGNYKFEVYDSLSNVMIYSRGYSTLFAEWRATPEAKLANRSFSESVVFPMPKNTVKLVFYGRKKDMTWEKQYEIHVNPKSHLINRKPKLEARNFKIHDSGKPETKLDIVLISEGYTEAEMQKFMNDAMRFKGYLLGSEPFKSQADKINIWVVPVTSQESGTDIPGENVWKNTAFDSHFYTFDTERYLNTENNKKIRDAAANAPYDQIYLLVNSSKYGGAGIYNYYSICTADDKFSDFVFTHEFGHAFAGLGDEYYTSDVSVEDFYNLAAEPWEPNLTTLVDFGSKWKSMLDAGTPVPTPDTKENQTVLGVFEGGGYVEKGVYRPVHDCTMKSIKYDNFCPVCTKSIIDMINFYSK